LVLLVRVQPWQADTHRGQQGGTGAMASVKGACNAGPERITGGNAAWPQRESIIPPGCLSSCRRGGRLSLSLSFLQFLSRQTHFTFTTLPSKNSRRCWPDGCTFFFFSLLSVSISCNPVYDLFRLAECQFRSNKVVQSPGLSAYSLLPVALLDQNAALFRI
jgi:hypothetical protein